MVGAGVVMAMERKGTCRVPPRHITKADIWRDLEQLRQAYQGHVRTLAQIEEIAGGVTARVGTIPERVEAMARCIRNLRAVAAAQPVDEPQRSWSTILWRALWG